MYDKDFKLCRCVGSVRKRKKWQGRRKRDKKTFSSRVSGKECVLLWAVATAAATAEGGGLEEGGLLAENFWTRTCVPSRRVRKFANYFQLYLSYTIFEEQDWQK